MVAILVSLVPLGSLAAFAGAHPSATLPILAGAFVVFLVSRAHVGGAETRWLDGALIALAAGVLIQIVQLPEPVVTLVSPKLQDLDAALHLDDGTGPGTLSVDPRITRAGLASLVSALLVFWASRETFSRGGVRATARIVAWAGFAVTLIALIQRATAPGSLLWRWNAVDPGSQPFGPFVNRNHFATWLVMAAALTAGYLVAHSRSVVRGYTSVRLKLRDWLSDGNGLLVLASLMTMLIGIVATLSRAAILGVVVALGAAAVLSRPDQRGRTARITVAAMAAMLCAGIWANREELARKFDAATTIGRFEIWRETMPVIRDFWLTGTGLGTYGPTMLRYQRGMRDVHFNQAHNEYLQLAAEGGLLLILPSVAALAAGLRLARRRLRYDRRVIAWVRIGAAAGLAGIAVQSLFETGLRMPANGLLAALLAAVVVHEPARVSTPDANAEIARI